MVRTDSEVMVDLSICNGNTAKISAETLKLYPNWLAGNLSSTLRWFGSLAT